MKALNLKQKLIVGTIALLSGVALDAVDNVRGRLKNYYNSFLNNHLATSDSHASAIPPMRSVPAEYSDSVIEIPDESLKARFLDYVSIESMIMRHEGCELIAYDDSKGNRTIGVGFNLDRHGAREKIESLGISYDDLYSNKTSLTKDQALNLFRDDYHNAIGIAKRFVGVDEWYGLDKIARGVVIDMAMMGEGSLNGFKNFRTALRTHDYQKASDEMVDSKWYSDVKSRGVELEGLMRGINR